MKVQKNSLYALVALIAIVVLTSCDPQKKLQKDFNFFQRGLDSIKTQGYREPVFKENDLVSIQVIAGSLRQDDAALFNLANGGGSGVSTSATAATNSSQGYLIDLDGNIEMPKIGKIKAAGLTKQQLAKAITDKLADEVKNVLVVVKFAQFKINVLGEVKKPGTVVFRTDKASILDAIGEAGDLSDYGKREDVLVMRQTNGKYETYKIDLRSTDFMNSPAYQMQQNDVVYVGANDIKLKTLNINPTFQRDFTLIVTTVSTLFLILNAISIIKRG